MKTLLFTASVAAAVFLSLGSNEDPGQTVPSPALSAEAVVRVQLSALADNNTPLPNSGVSTAFAFASPANKQQTGPLDRFTLMVNSEPYDDMLNHRDAEIIDVQPMPAHTLVTVQLTTRDNRQRRYVFALSRHTTADCKDCWMTDGVMAGDSEPKAQLI